MTGPFLQAACSLKRGPFTLAVDVESSAKVIGLFGASGSGKTTLLHAIAGLVKPHDGFIKLGGTTLVNIRAGWNTPPEGRRVGLVFQENRLFPHLTVEENLTFGYRRMPRAVRRVHPEDVIPALGLDALLNRRPPSLSGGEARRVAIARALLMSPALLLLDEPLTGLDAALRGEVLALLADLKQRLHIPMVYVSHTLPDILALADEAWVIENGAVARLDSPFALLHRTGAAEGIESWLPGTVVAPGLDAGFAEVDLAGRVLTVRADGVATGDRAWVCIPAADVLLAAGDAGRVSARNRLDGTVASIRPIGGRVLVTVDIGLPLQAELTAAAVRELDLRPGTPVRVLLKAVVARAHRGGIAIPGA